MVLLIFVTSLESDDFWMNRDKDKSLINPDSLEGLQDNTLLSYRSMELQQQFNNFFTVWPDVPYILNNLE